MRLSVFRRGNLEEIELGGDRTWRRGTLEVLS
jgi:hypothetical protein